VCTPMLVGWSMADHLRTELFTDALASAAATRGRRTFAVTVFHSDNDRLNPPNIRATTSRRSAVV
jgi:transposase InsO family protein